MRMAYVATHRVEPAARAKRIEQIGSHADLMTQDGLYREMVERQQRLFPETAEALQWD